MSTFFPTCSKTFQLMAESFGASPNMVLHNVTTIVVTQSKFAAGNTGARKFIKDYFSALKLSNPGLDIQRVVVQEKVFVPPVRVIGKEGNEKILEVGNKHADVILDELKVVDKEL